MTNKDPSSSGESQSLLADLQHEMKTEEDERMFVPVKRIFTTITISSDSENDVKPVVKAYCRHTNEVFVVSDSH